MDSHLLYPLPVYHLKTSPRPRTSPASVAGLVVCGAGTWSRRLPLARLQLLHHAHEEGRLHHHFRAVLRVQVFEGCRHGQVAERLARGGGSFLLFPPEGGGVPPSSSP